MVSFRAIAAAFASVALLVQPSIAHSIKRNPIAYASFVEDAVIKAPSHRVHSHSHFDLIFTLHEGSQEIRLKLEPNDDIIHDSFAITHLGADGQVRSVESIERSEHKIYKGDAFVHRLGHDGWFKAGWARIMIHRDGSHPIFEGSFRIDGTNHNIQTGDHYQHVKHEDDPLMDAPGDINEVMVVWRDSDILTDEGELKDLKRGISGHTSCYSDELQFNSGYHELDARNSHFLGAMSPRTIFGRQSIDGGPSGNNGAGVDLLSTIGSVDGCPTTRKVALVGIATDCTYTAAFNSSETLRKNVISLVNQASRIYESTFNISLGIQNLTISDRSCPGTPPSSAPWNQACSKSVDLSSRLSLFSSWRGKFDDDNAYWTLLSTCNTDSAVGLAWLGQLCRSGASSDSDGSGNNETVSSANVVVRTSAEWQVFAHETGHIFGAVHDCTASTCPVSSGTQSCCPLSKSTCDAGGKYIMNPSTSDTITEFSPCSIGNICSGLKRNIKSTCLSNNKNVATISGSQCGNGIVESGEECDCGGEAGCGTNSCCDAKTCKLKNNAQCDPTNEECCTDSCKFASSGTVCRESTGDCDPKETCSGTSGSCPADEHLKDGASCGDGLSCASGQCTSRDLQCRNMFGNTSISSTAACGDSSCLMTCQAPDYGYGSCVELNQNFLDGTSCGGGGHCSNGDCVGSSTSKEILNWFKRNKNIVIPVGAAIGALILIAICSCIVSSIRRRRRRAVHKPADMSRWPNMSRSVNDVGPPNGPPPSYNYTPVGREHEFGRVRSMRYA
ncbi:Metallo-peptidase family M12-domain-containing protein [Mariannaea sp. PMI_226]|nr:Metallo-peptidase family M12-domain-containing protein [Mariannaea sp. PMI_226]